MPQDTPSRKLDQYIVRFPAGMRDRIKRAAEAHGRSMNAEIVQALEQMFPVEPTREELTFNLYQYLNHALLPGSKSYNQDLNEALITLLDRLSVGVDFQRKTPVLSPRDLEGVELLKRIGIGLLGGGKKGMSLPDQPVKTEDFARILATDLLESISHDRKRQALKKVSENDLAEAIYQLGLQPINFEDPASALEALRYALNSVLSGYDLRER